MNVGTPINSVIPSLDGPVLAALAGSVAPLRLSEVHRLAGRGSLSGVRRVLLRLVGTGVVEEVPGGFVLNREHVAAPAVELLAGLHGQLIERIRIAVQEWAGEVALVGLFGSAARREGNEESDIDVVVVSDSSDLDDLTEHLRESIRRWTGNEAQVVGLSTGDARRLRRAREPILPEWERDLLVISGDRRALLAAA